MTMAMQTIAFLLNFGNNPLIFVIILLKILNEVNTELVGAVYNLGFIFKTL